MGNQQDLQDETVATTTSSNPLGVSAHLFASGTGAAAAALAFQPLDVLKTRLQVHRVSSTALTQRPSMIGCLRNIYHQEGARGLYRGTIPTLMSVVPSISIYFTLYSQFKYHLNCGQGDSFRDVLLQSISAGAASIATTTITNPLWVIKARLQTNPYVQGQRIGTWSTFQSIIRERGFRGLYKGLSASFLASTQAMVQLPLYEQMKRLLCCHPDSDNIKQKTACYLAAGSISASLSSIITYPSEVIRSRLQVQGSLSSLPDQYYKGLFGAFRTIYLEEGFRGLYRGLGINLIRLVPSHAMSFTLYEFVLRFLDTHWYNPKKEEVAEADIDDSPIYQFARENLPTDKSFESTYTFNTQINLQSFFALPNFANHTVDAASASGFACEKQANLTQLISKNRSFFSKLLF